MLQKKLRVEQFERVYKLEPVSVDLAADRIVGFLTSLNFKRDTIIRVRLSVEEALLRWVDHFKEEKTFRLEMGTHWNRPYVVLKLWGSEFDPLTESENDLGLWADELLGAIGLIPVFRYVGGCNILQIPLKRPHRNPGVVLLLSTLAGAVVGIVTDLVLNEEVQMLFASTILTPLQNAFIRVLNAVSAPVLFLSILTTVCGVGSISITGTGGKRLIRRFLTYCTLFTIITMLLCRRLFNLPVGSVSLSTREVSGVLDFFLDIFPGDVLSPFIQGDFTQIIVVGLVLGNALLIAGAKVQTLVTIVEEANTVGLGIAEWIGDISPGFVALLIVLGIHESTIHMLWGIWKPCLLITLFSLIALFIKLLHVSLRYKVPVTTLCLKMKDSFILSLTTFSVESSYTANQKCCEKGFGISRQLTSFGLPIGLICFMPVSTIASMVLTMYAAECYQVTVSGVWMIMALFLAVTLAAAGPPTAGIGILTYTVMFGKLHIPAQALTIALAADILMGFAAYPVNQAMLQLELVLEAEKQGLLNQQRLTSPARSKSTSEVK